MICGKVSRPSAPRRLSIRFYMRNGTILTKTLMKLVLSYNILSVLSEKKVRYLSES